MRDLHTSTSLVLLAAALTAGLALTGCGKSVQTTTTTKTASAAPITVASAARVAPTAPAGAIAPAGPGLVDDTSQTAALSAPANANGTTPAKGVTLPPSR